MSSLELTAQMMNTEENMVPPFRSPDTNTVFVQISAARFYTSSPLSLSPPLTQPSLMNVGKTDYLAFYGRIDASLRIVYPYRILDSEKGNKINFKLIFSKII